MIKAISFDLDGTLADERFDKLVWHQEIPALYAKEYGLNFQDAYKHVSTEYSRMEGKTDRWLDIAFWFEHLKLKTDWRTLVHGMKDELKVFDDVIPCLKQLKQHYRLVVISLADRKFITLKMEADWLERYFDNIFSASSDFNKLVKDKSLYRSVLKRLGLSAEELVHVGDNIQFDYAVPNSLGITSFIIDRHGAHAGPHVIRSLHELEGKL